MGTAPQNFPPDAVLNVGGVLTGNKLGLTGSLSSTVFFTAPVSGVYLISAVMQIVSTDAAGSLATTITTPSAGTISLAASGAAKLKDLAPAGPTDGFMLGTPVWMNANQQISAATVATGLTGTTYNLFISALRLF